MNTPGTEYWEVDIEHREGLVLKKHGIITLRGSNILGM